MHCCVLSLHALNCRARNHRVSTRRALITFSLALALAISTLAPSEAAFAQEHAGHGAGAAKPAAVLMSGYGNWHHPVSTKNAQAQAFFDQGLRQIYAFNHDEAARSFQRAGELDPKLAMAFWGVAEAVGPNYNDPASEDRFVRCFRERQGVHRRAGQALPGRPPSGFARGRGAISRCHARSDETLPRRSGCSHAVRRSGNEFASLGAVAARRYAGRRHGRNCCDARVGDSA